MRSAHAALLPALLSGAQCGKLCFATTADGAYGMACSSALCAWHAGDLQTPHAVRTNLSSACVAALQMRWPGCLHVAPGGMLAASMQIWGYCVRISPRMHRCAEHAEPDAAFRRGEAHVLLGWCVATMHICEARPKSRAADQPACLRAWSMSLLACTIARAFDAARTICSCAHDLCRCQKMSGVVCV